MKFGITHFLLILILIAGCSKRTTLEDELSCSRFISLAWVTQRTDIHKNFKIDIPSTWKHKLYYDDYQSAIFMADTLKELTKTYILDASWKHGELNLDEAFEATISNQNSLALIKSNFEEYKGYPSYWNISKGKKKGFTYHIFEMFMKTSVDTYLEVKIDFYGEELVDERLCEALNILSTIEFI